MSLQICSIRSRWRLVCVALSRNSLAIRRCTSYLLIQICCIFGSGLMQVVEFTYRKLLIFQNHVMQKNASIHDSSYLVDIALTRRLLYNPPTSLESWRTPKARSTSFRALSCRLLNNLCFSSRAIVNDLTKVAHCG